MDKEQIERMQREICGHKEYIDELLEKLEHAGKYISRLEEKTPGASEGEHDTMYDSLL